jgi:hypothetical protein
LCRLHDACLPSTRRAGTAHQLRCGRGKVVAVLTLVSGGRLCRLEHVRGRSPRQPPLPRERNVSPGLEGATRAPNEPAIRAIAVSEGVPPWRVRSITRVFRRSLSCCGRDAWLWGLLVAGLPWTRRGRNACQLRCGRGHVVAVLTLVSGGRLCRLECVDGRTPRHPPSPRKRDV